MKFLVDECTGIYVSRKLKQMGYDSVSKNEVSQNLAMSRTTFFKYWKELEKSDALITTHWKSQNVQTG